MSFPIRPRTGPGRETQVIFDRPELQARRHRWAYSSLTLVAWMIWMYLWLPVVTVLAWYLGIRVFAREILPSVPAMLEVTVKYSLVILAIGLVLVAWSQYNYRRFRGVNRRRAAAPLSDAETSERFGVSPEELRMLRGESSLTMRYDAEGRFLAVQPGMQTEVHPSDEPEPTAPLPVREDQAKERAAAR